MTRFVALVCICIALHLPASSVLHADEMSPLVSSSYFGRFGFDDATDVAVDADGFVYVAGWTESFAFPSTGLDAFVLKLTPDGSQIVYATYLRGSAFDIAMSLAVDAAGAVYVVGHTTSADFPLVQPFQAVLHGRSDVWIAKLDPSGAVVYSTYYGGSSFEDAAAIALGPQGELYVAGKTGSADLPGATGVQPTFAGGFGDAFLMKLGVDATGPAYATYLGGSGDEAATTLVVDRDGRAHVAGHTSSPNFPLARALQATFGGGSSDGFVASVAPDGASLMFATYLGGVDFEAVTGFAVSPDGAMYLAGTTGSYNFPTRNAIQPYHQGGFGDAFVAKLHSAGAAIEFSTFVGGQGHDFTADLSVDARGNIHLVGGTGSLDFPLFPPAEEWMHDHNAFVAQLSSDGQTLLRSMPLGGTQFDTATGVALSPGGDVWVVGRTESADFPVLNAFQPWYEGSADVFVSRLMSVAPANKPPIGYAGKDQHLAADGCVRQVVLNGSLSKDPDGDPLTFTWSGDFGTSQGEVVMVELPPGVHTITLTVDDGRDGQATDTVTITVLDAMAPWIERVSATPDVLSPPNHQMVPISVSVDLTGSCEASTDCRIVAVSSNEAADGSGDGGTGADWEITGPLTLLVRAERDAHGDGRVYTVTVECVDAAGNTSRKTVEVFVQRP